MKLPILLLLFTHCLFAAETKYEDQPYSMSEDRMLEIMKPYEAKAKASLDYFIEQFQLDKERAFYVVTRLYQGNHYEQIFVRLEQINGTKFLGKIASSPLGKVDFKNEDPIEIEKDEIVDWLIVNKDGTEEGNLQGKASDLLHIGRCAFICEMTPNEGIFQEFKVVSVVNPATKQNVIDIAPTMVIDQVEEKVSEIHKGSISEDGEHQYTYLIVKFPEWEIEEPKE